MNKVIITKNYSAHSNCVLCVAQYPGSRGYIKVTRVLLCNCPYNIPCKIEMPLNKMLIDKELCNIYNELLYACFC